MADKSAIEWTDATWNPVSGCTKVSAGCDNCYAERIAERFRGTAGHPFEHGFDLTLHPKRLGQPARWTRPRRIFVNSMSDLFHKGVSAEYRESVFNRMIVTDRHTYQVLTKRSPTMRSFVNARFDAIDPLPPHIWVGVSIENADALVRLEHLVSTNAAMRFLSIEPLIGYLGPLDLTGIRWVIVGGESGPRARPIDPAWVRDLRDQCQEQGVAFFFKQWGGARPKANGNELDGRQWLEYPEVPGAL